MSQPVSKYDSELVSEFSEALATGILDNYIKRTFGKSSEFSESLDETQLQSLTTDLSLSIYRASGGRKVREFKKNSIEDIGDTIDFLLYDNIKLEGRFYECVSDFGSYKLLGAGKEFISYLLHIRDPLLFGMWNGSAEKSLKLLGWDTVNLKKGPWGIRYIDLLDMSYRIQSRFRLPDLRSVDQFNHWIVRFSPISQINKLR
ncbi:MAG: hypothetical protein VX966_08820 [Chloroflexota bacterium]|nr:hypothetical protein [Chloroflexota bacterium]